MSVLARHLLPDHTEVTGDGALRVGGVDAVGLAEEFGTERVARLTDEDVRERVAELHRLTTFAV